MAAITDILIVGEDVPSLVAAAIAAQSGARTILLSVPSTKTPELPSISNIPNAVWRRLNLHDHDIRFEPVHSRVSLFADKNTVLSFRDDNETAVLLQEKCVDDAEIWTAFADEMRSVSELTLTPPPGQRDGAFALLDDVSRVRQLAILTGSACELVGDFFSDPDVQTHLRAHALATAGYCGREAGTAAALPDFFSKNALPVRPVGGVEKLSEVLRTICKEHGVEMRTSRVAEISPDGARANTVIFEDGEKIRCRRILFASPQAAAASGLRADGALAHAAGAARGVLRISLRKPMLPPAGDETSIFHLLQSSHSLNDARRDVLNGKIPEHLPVSFEYVSNGDMIVYTSFIPSRLRNEEGERDWTGQDRQLLTKGILATLGLFFDGIHANIRAKKLVLDVMEEPRLNPFDNALNLFIQPRHHDAIAAAVALVDKVLADG